MKALLCIFGLSVALAACGGSISTKDECIAAGGHVVSALGPPAECPAGEEEIGQIPEGIEGAVCCR